MIITPKNKVQNTEELKRKVRKKVISSQEQKNPNFELFYLQLIH